MEIGSIRHEMQRLKVVLISRNDYVAVNQPATHLPSLSRAKALKQSGHGMSVGDGGIQSDERNV